MIRTSRKSRPLDRSLFGELSVHDNLLMGAYTRMDRDAVARDIFERAGAYLGLAIAKHIVQAHGGRIWAESELGRGAAFHMTLPLSLPTGENDGGHTERLDT